MKYKPITHKDFAINNWLREKLPSGPQGLVISDLDFILYNYKTKRLMLIELKQYGREVEWWQKQLFNVLHTAMTYGLKNTKIEYLGFNLITFPKKDFTESETVLWNKEEIGEPELIRRLSI